MGAGGHSKLPVLLLHFGSPLRWTLASIVVLAVCVALLVPFILELRSQLDMVSVARRLGRRAMSEYEVGNNQKVRSWSPDPSPAALTLIDVSYSAYAAKDFYVFRATIDQVGLLVAGLLRRGGRSDSINVLKDQLTDVGRAVNEAPANPALRVTRSMR